MIAEQAPDGVRQRSAQAQGQAAPVHRGDSPVSDALLKRMQYLADPPADDTVARIVGDWRVLGADAGAHDLRAAHEAQWLRLAQATSLLEQLGDNGSLEDWSPHPQPGIDGVIVRAVEDYVRANQALPAWARPDQLQRAETLFMDYGPLSCILLFCASLPECYVLPDLSAVLHMAGQLEQRTEYRIRSTAAMIFPVMMKGGMGEARGNGRAQVLKVRLIHATIRNLILRGRPSDVVGALGDAQNRVGAGVVVPHPALAGGITMYEAMFAAGWKLGEDGLPCNQEELAYTLLTFSYVFLRGMRHLGLGLPPADEEAFLHCWNVTASVMGVREDLMAHTMVDAAALFERMQSRGRADVRTPDPRPGLGHALMQAMEDSIPLPWLKPFAVLMTRHLCGTRTAALIGVQARAPWRSRVLFKLVMGLVRGVDALLRLVWPRFSITRLLTRVLGYHLMVRLLLDQTRPLKLPQGLLNHVNTMLDAWGHDRDAPMWMNRLEDRWTTPGAWRG
jgi:hypothetical protein